jgi:hypothetical protein
MGERVFECGPARRERTPLAIGVIGPSGSGKTKSALRLADGMARVVPGDTWVVDTNNRRSLHHADDHKFIALHMQPPYSPSDFGQAFQHAIKSGARRIVVDNMSDEWDGEGGVLDMHEDELDRRTNGDDKARDKMNAAAWITPKRVHNRLKLWMFNQPVDWILTFRAKEKTKPVTGKGMQDQGWQPIGAEDLIYELLLKCLLRPQADGRPTWTSNIVQEQALMKLPGWFRELFTNAPVLSEDIGEKLARWAAGASVPAPDRSGPAPVASPTRERHVDPDPIKLIARFDACTGHDDLTAIDRDVRSVLDRIPQAARGALTEAATRAFNRVNKK